jgi:hypothetical protein
MPHVRAASLPSHTFHRNNHGQVHDSLKVNGFLQATGGALSVDPISRSVETRTTNAMEDLNVIIPIGGLGSRFQKEGYRFPKPLINIVGKPMLCWLIEHLCLRPTDTIWIAISDKIDEEFQLGQLMRKWFPKLSIQLIRLNYLTKGAIETVSTRANHSLFPAYTAHP